MRVPNPRKLEGAKHVASIEHAGQFYGNGRRIFIHHLEDVEQNIRHFALQEELVRENYGDLLVAAWLHDILEDTDYNPMLLKEQFGLRVFELVKAVTAPAGLSRKDKMEAVYLSVARGGPVALALKLADRIANTRYSLENSDRQYWMYRQEYPGFKEALHKSGILARMWGALEYLNSEQAARLHATPSS